MFLRTTESTLNLKAPALTVKGDNLVLFNVLGQEELAGDLGSHSALAEPRFSHLSNEDNNNSKLEQSTQHMPDAITYVTLINPHKSLLYVLLFMCHFHTRKNQNLERFNPMANPPNKLILLTPNFCLYALHPLQNFWEISKSESEQVGRCRGNLGFFSENLGLNQLRTPLLCNLIVMCTCFLSGLHHSNILPVSNGPLHFRNSLGQLG